MTRILAIDPGPIESAYVVVDDEGRPLISGKVANDEMRDLIGIHLVHVVIEMVASYGMAVGAEVFDTCVWIGRFLETAEEAEHPTRLIKRPDVKLHHCHNRGAKDSNVRQALVDRFAYGQPNSGKGTKAAPGWFYGFHADIWQAYALAIKALDDGKGDE